MIKTISVTELKKLIDEDADFKLIDVREDYETEIATLFGELIPLAEVLENVEKFKTRAEKVIVYCRSGKRSATAIGLIQNKAGVENLYNLEGGILAWADEIDNTVTKY